MKELLADALGKKLAATLESLGGAKALFGNAAAGIRVSIEPVGYLRAGPQGPVYHALGGGHAD